MKKLLLLIVAVVCCFPASAQVYYKKVPKLILQADGTYNVAYGEYDYVPVDAAGRRISEKSTQEKEAADRVEAARWAGVAPQQTAEVAPREVVEEKNSAKKEEVVKQKSAIKTENCPYLSVGAAGMNSTLSIADESAFAPYIEQDLSSTQAGVKGTFGAWLSEYTRAEVFFQWRSGMSKSGTLSAPFSNIQYTAKTKMWDIGANAFLYANPHSNVRFFIGAGIAATRVQPSMTLNGIDINDAKLVIGGKTYRFELFESQFFATPSGFAGVEFAVGENADMDVMFFYSQTNVHKDGIDVIKSFGLSANVRFNLKRRGTETD